MLLQTVREVIIAIVVLMIKDESRRDSDVIKDIAVGIVTKRTGYRYHTVHSIFQEFIKHKTMKQLKALNGTLQPRYDLTQEGEQELKEELRALYDLLSKLFGNPDSARDTRIAHA